MVNEEPDTHVPEYTPLIQPDPPVARPRMQFSLGTLLASIFYAATLATITVNVAGKAWNPAQIAAAYLTTIAFIVGFTVLSRERTKIDAYLLLLPLVFISSISAAAVFQSSHNTYKPPPRQPPIPATTIPAPTGNTPTSDQ